MKFKLVPITSIRKVLYSGEVYDLTVKNSHSYNVFNIIVHNSICSTRLRTGFGIPTLTSILDCAEVKEPGVFLVADGGVEHPGDICKAIAAGADMVMAGKLFAATSMSPGRKYDSFGAVFGGNASENDSSVKWVEYRGQASKEAQTIIGQGKTHSVEGVSGTVPYQGKTEEYIPSVLKNLANAMVYYGGCTDWASFKRHAKFVELTPQGWGESNTRVSQI